MAVVARETRCPALDAARIQRRRAAALEHELDRIGDELSAAAEVNTPVAPAERTRGIVVTKECLDNPLAKSCL